MARQRLGQHFLRSQTVLERIALSVCPEPQPLVIEIGPGKGALTAHLLRRAERVIAIELDRALAVELRQKYEDEPRLTIIEGDALAADLAQWGPAVIAGNLPYYAATAIIERVLDSGAGLRWAVFLIQKEVAERMAASPGGREYGFLSVRTQLAADCAVLFRVKPAAFQPPPKVESAVVRLRPRPGVAPDPEFLAFIGHCFRQKRKMLRNNLSGLYPKDLIEAIPEGFQRAERLTLSQFAQTYRRLVAYSKETIMFTPEQAQGLAMFLAMGLEKEQQTTKKVLAAVPAESLDFKLGDKGRTAGALMAHIVSSELWFADGIESGEFKSGAEAVSATASSAEIQEIFATKVPEALARVKELSAEQLAKPINFMNFMTLPAVVFIQFWTVHTVHHRGQLAAYIRAMNAKVPSIYGPSADESY
ncbi:MAG: ribosomal RNA small subunit methyltransferase A [Bryobacterales bacterium]|nr:ribosomal RNA small subunit methyltransferase A [Bryobacterales bacterium]